MSHLTPLPHFRFPLFSTFHLFTLFSIMGSEQQKTTSANSYGSNKEYCRCIIYVPFCCFKNNTGSRMQEAVHHMQRWLLHPGIEGFPKRRIANKNRAFFYFLFWKYITRHQSKVLKVMDLIMKTRWYVAFYYLLQVGLHAVIENRWLIQKLCVREGGGTPQVTWLPRHCRRHFTFFFEVCELFDNCPVSERYSILCVWSGHILYFTYILCGPIVWSDSIMLDEWYVQNLSMFCGLALWNWQTFACCSWIQSVYCHWFFVVENSVFIWSFQWRSQACGFYVVTVRRKLELRC